MLRIKYMFLLYLINFINNIGETSSKSVCQYASGKKKTRKEATQYFNNDPNANFWEYLTPNKKPKNGFWERYQSATQCFTWEAFEESDDSFQLPFEKLINGIEYLITDFIRFYVEYISAFFSTLWKWTIFRFFFNPASIFALAIYMFNTKFFMPLVRNIREQLELDDDPEFCPTCEVVKGDQLLTETEVQDE